MALTNLELRVVLAHFCSICFVSSASLPAMLIEESFTCCTASVAAALKALMMACPQDMNHLKHILIYDENAVLLS